MHSLDGRKHLYYLGDSVLRNWLCLAEPVHNISLEGVQALAGNRRHLFRQDAYILDLEFRSSILQNIPNLPTHCDGCGARFTIAHGISARKVDLVGKV